MTGDYQKKRFSAPLAGLIAIFVAIAFLLALELLLRAVGAGKAFCDRDPFYGFEKPRRLFEEKQKRGAETIYSSDTAWQKGQFNVQRFVMPKPKQTFRIFCFGGSTVFGFPFWDPGSFPRILERTLAAAAPLQRFEVINAGGMGYASNRIRLIINECLAYEPDMIILYTGNNEYLEDQFRKEALDKPEWVLKLRAGLYGLRIYGVLAEAVLGIMDKASVEPGSGKGLFEELGTRVESDKLAWSTDQRRKVEVMFDWNIREIIKACGDKGVQLMLIEPAVNLRDYPPNLSEGPEGAEHDFLAGREALSAGDPDRARLEFSRACDRDLMPTRITGALREIMRKNAAQKDIIFLSAQEVFDENSAGHIPGYDLFFDHCHPLLNGSVLIAQSIMEAMIKKGVVVPRNKDAWDRDFRRASMEMLESFPDDYIADSYTSEARFLYQHMNRPRRAGDLIDYALGRDPDSESAQRLKAAIDERIRRENPQPWY